MMRWWDGWPRDVVGLLVAVALAMGVTLAYTWPMLHHYQDVVMGGGELGGWLWRYDWHFREVTSLDALDVGWLQRWTHFVGLGRYPETGNILDVLLLSFPLQEWFGFPASYNLKVFLILTLNGVCGYALARYFSGSVSAALAASVIAIANPLTELEVQACGLRQAVLWWVLLYPPLLDRALRRRSVASGLAAGLVWGAAGAWYWFYGLFTGLFTAVWVARHLWGEWERLDRRGVLRSLVGVGIGVALAAGPFILPYLLGDGTARGKGGLPEVTFFLPFPPYDTIAYAPLRPSTYAENLAASLHRTIGSSWSASYPFDPTLNVSLPLTVLLVGVLPALRRRRMWGWLLIWAVFYVGTLGPFLRWGPGDNLNVLKIADTYVIRLPFVWMFQFIPGMSRMFAPYRLAAYVVVASVSLVALTLGTLRWRYLAAPVVIAATLAQPMLRLGKGSINESGTDRRELRSPFKMTKIDIPAFYHSLDPAVAGGIVELPMDQQQDLVCYYQILHRQKVFRSWATPGSLPPWLRRSGGGEVGERLRFQAEPDEISGPIPEVWAGISKEPGAFDLSPLATAALTEWSAKGNYRYAILHERGYFLVDPQKGALLYQTAVARLREVLQQTPVEIEEFRRGNPADPEFGVPVAGDLVPWSSQPPGLPPELTPPVYHMAVFTLPGDGT